MQFFSPKTNATHWTNFFNSRPILNLKKRKEIPSHTYKQLISYEVMYTASVKAAEHRRIFLWDSWSSGQCCNPVTEVVTFTDGKYFTVVNVKLFQIQEQKLMLRENKSRNQILFSRKFFGLSYFLKIVSHCWMNVKIQ